MEAFPNGDALKYADVLGIEPNKLTNLGRYALRWAGHSEFWRKIVNLHLLDDGTVMVDNKPVDRRRYLATALSPYLQYSENQQDIVIIRIEVVGWKYGKKYKAVFQVIDKRDLKTGFTAMNRTVGYTASIGAQMIGTGKINKTGVLSPINDIPYQTFIHELKCRGIHVTSEIIAC